MRNSVRAVMRPAAFSTLLLLVAAGRSPAASIPIGYCSSLKEIDAARAAGFDYVELRTSEVAALPDADFDTLAGGLKRNGLASHDRVPSRRFRALRLEQDREAWPNVRSVRVSKSATCALRLWSAPDPARFDQLGFPSH